MKHTFPLPSMDKRIVTGLLVLLIQCQLVWAQRFPPNFAGVQLATGLDPVGMDVAPDGRVFLAEKTGKLRIVKNGTLLPTPFITIPNVDNFNERGLQKVVLDPDFSTNNYLYVYYTYKAAGSSVSNNRVSRLTANGDVALAGSERVLIDIDPLGSVGYHNGGGLAIQNGKLFIAVGENTVAANAQSFTTLKGKVLRINLDGSIPTDNPFYATATGVNRAIWALGFRNPFRISAQPGTSRLFINDVGNATWEEINEGLAGKNYGWPGIEGMRTTQSQPTAYQDPMYVYDHSQGCSITAGAFYNPATAQFPASYVGSYFFGDYCNGWLKTIDPVSRTVTTFATGIDRPLDVAVSSTGVLYFIARGGIAGGSDAANTASTNGVLWRVDYTGTGAPVIAVQPTSRTISVGQSTTFSVTASGNPAPAYQWQRNGVTLNGATAATYSLSNPTLSDDGAKFKVVVTNSAGSVTSAEATLRLIANTPPVATISTPTLGKTYSGGDVIAFSGTGTDTEDGDLSASSFSWKVDLYHFDTPAHAHPALEPVSGSKSGTFTIPTQMETSANVLFRIVLTVTDSKGATATVYRDVVPTTARITLATSPAGLSVKLDGSSVTAPYTFTGVSGIVRALEAVPSQTVGGVTYTFASWSNGGARAQSLSTPATSTMLTATFVPATASSTPIVAGGVYELEPQPAPGQRLDVRGVSTADGTIVELYQRNGGGNQRWTFIARGNGLYELEPRHAPGKRLDVAGISAADNVKVQLYTSNGGSNQRWKLIDLGGDVYELEPQCAPGNRLDIGPLEGVTRAVSKRAAGTGSQRWKLVSTTAARLAADELGSEVGGLSATPNPLTTHTTIRFQRPLDSQQVAIEVYSPQGQLVRTIDLSTNRQGLVEFDRRDLKTGVYVYRLVVDGQSIAANRLLIN